MHGQRQHKVTSDLADAAMKAWWHAEGPTATSNSGDHRNGGFAKTKEREVRQRILLLEHWGGGLVWDECGPNLGQWA